MHRLYLPILTGFGMSLLCPIKGGERLPQTPPKEVFPLVWTILYLLVGLSWHRTRFQKESDAMHALLVFLLASWILLYSCLKQKTGGLYILACIFAVCISCMLLHDDKVSKIALTPLLAWIFIAYSLNFQIVSNDN